MRSIVRFQLVVFTAAQFAILAACPAWASERVTYKRHADRDLLMTITKPPGWSADDRRSAVIFFYNGGWKNPGSTKPQFEEQTRYFAARGMVVGQADYREKSKDGATSAKCVEDIFSAVRWLRGHAGELGLDPARIAAAGGSGSIHLPAAVFQTRAIAAPGEDASLNPLPGALFSFHPDPDVLEAAMMDRILSGGALEPGRQMPPTVVYWGSRDGVAPFLADFVARTRAAGLPVESLVGDGGVHGFYKFTPGLEKTTEHMDQKLRTLGFLSDQPKVELPHKVAPADYEERVLATQQQWLERHQQLAKERSPKATTPPVQKPEVLQPAIAAVPPATYVYQTFGERKLQLAAHYPPGWKATDQRTAMIFFSGGHKVQPDKNGKLPPLASERAELGLPVVNRGPGENHASLCDAFAKLGLVCLRVEYRTRGKDGVLPGDDIADAVSAMRWVRGHAATLGIDPNRVVAAGGSSGGYLAASLFAFEERYPASGDRNISARPNAIILYSPLVDWLEAGSMTESFLVVLNGDKELGAKVSPARHWRKDCPPTLVMVGSEEPPFTTVKGFAEKWKSAGAPMELFIAEGGEHGFFGKAAWLEKTLARTDEFLAAHGFLKEERRAEAAGPSEAGKVKTVAAKGGTDTASRLAGMLAKFPEADANKDGVLTMEEAAAFKGRSKKTKGAGSSEPAPAKPTATIAAVDPGVAPSKSWDANGDGRIGKDEFKGPAQLFQNMDLDGDGFLAGAELKKLDQKLSLDKMDSATWVVPPGEKHHGVEHHTYFSKAMQTEVGFNIYLPDEYATSRKRYPVIYHLHGSGGNESAQVDLSDVYHRAISEKKMCPVIIVFVNGGKRSYYSDGANGKILAETTIMRELIPFIDAEYRTIPEKACRVIHGFSMGGYGALKLGSKFPEQFCAVLSFGGGMAAPGSLHLGFLKQIVGDDERAVAANNPADLVIKNKSALAGMSWWLFTGTRDVAREDSTWAHQHLEEQGIPHRFEVSADVGHTLKKHYALFGDDIFKMLKTQFSASATFSKTAD